MLISQIDPQDFIRRLRAGDLLLNIQPFMLRLKSDIAELGTDIQQMYGDFCCGDETDFADFDVAVVKSSRIWPRGTLTARFIFDGLPFFTPLPAYQALAMFEWGVNWCIAAHAHQYLIIHAAVIERDGKAAILPAPPGSGKSTLCAALVCRGWRLLTDELALYDLDTGLLTPMARPVNLKNESISLIKAFEPTASMARVVPNTSKGSVSLMRPPTHSVLQIDVPAQPRWIVTPRYLAGASAKMESKGGAETFMLLAEQSFNYEIHGARGFHGLADLVEQTANYEFTYSKLDDAISSFEHLWAELD